MQQSKSFKETSSAEISGRTKKLIWRDRGTKVLPERAVKNQSIFFFFF